MLLGINFGHDASVSLHDENGNCLKAISEERINRIKGFWGFPEKSLEKILKGVNSDKVTQVFLASHSIFKRDYFQVYNYLFSTNTENFFDLANQNIPPGWFNNNGIKSLLEKPKNDESVQKIIHKLVEKKLKSVNLTCDFKFVNHHDSHGACAIVGSQYPEALVVTLDGEGDFESGTISYFDGKNTNPLLRIPSNLSWGYLYTEATKYYGFKRNRHEGKLTGLSAHTTSSQLKYLINKYSYFADGKIFLQKLQDKDFNKKDKKIFELLMNHDKNESDYLQALLSILSVSSKKYSELAYLVQQNLELKVSEMIKFFTKVVKTSNVVLAGGVFANVKLNQTISELNCISNLYIYPNMGDGGLSVGSVWKHCLDSGLKPLSHDNLYLGDDEKLISTKDYKKISNILAQELKNGKVVGIFEGKSEWGPRALGHRSILANPNYPEINNKLNTRLERTDFMPFAPIVLSENAHKIFKLNLKNHVSNYENMVVTCKVKNKFKKLLSAAIHIDGTARPQIVNNEIGVVNSILKEFSTITGVPGLLNTSFNVHEEPIVETESQAMRALKEKRIDVLLTPNGITKS